MNPSEIKLRATAKLMNELIENGWPDCFAAKEAGKIISAETEESLSSYLNFKPPWGLGSGIRTAVHGGIDRGE